MLFGSRSQAGCRKKNTFGLNENAIHFFEEAIGNFNWLQMKNGILLSRLLLLDVIAQMERCRKDDDVESIAPDRWLGRCIRRASRGAVDCFNEEEVIEIVVKTLIIRRQGFI